MYMYKWGINKKPRNKKKSQCFSMNMITMLNKILIMTIYQKKKTKQEVKPIVTNALLKNFNKLM